MTTQAITIIALISLLALHATKSFIYLPKTHPTRSFILAYNGGGDNGGEFTHNGASKWLTNKTSLIKVVENDMRRLSKVVNKVSSSFKPTINPTTSKHHDPSVLPPQTSTSQNTAYLYVLSCTSSCKYIGVTYDLDERLSQHRSGTACAWTTKHKVVELEEWAEIPVGYGTRDVRGLEDRVTMEYMGEYGIDKVRGGSYTQVNLDPLQLSFLTRELQKLSKSLPHITSPLPPPSTATAKNDVFSNSNNIDEFLPSDYWDESIREFKEEVGENITKISSDLASLRQDAANATAVRVWLTTLEESIEENRSELSSLSNLVGEQKRLNAELKLIMEDNLRKLEVRQEEERESIREEVKAANVVTLNNLFTKMKESNVEEMNATLTNLQNSFHTSNTLALSTLSSSIRTSNAEEMTVLRDEMKNANVEDLNVTLNFLREEIEGATREFRKSQFKLTLEVMKLVGDKRENGRWRKKLGNVLCAPFGVFRSGGKARVEEGEGEKNHDSERYRGGREEGRRKNIGKGGKGEVETINLEDWY